MLNNTYGATLLVAFGQAFVPALVVAARAAQVVANNLNVVVECRVGGGGSVLEDGDPGRTVSGTDTEIHWSIVAGILTFDGVPLARLCDRQTGRVDVVLSGCWAALMGVVGVGVWACQRVRATSFSVQGDGLALGTFETCQLDVPIRAAESVAYQDSRYGRLRRWSQVCSPL